MVWYFARQKLTHIHTALTLLSFVYQKEVADPPDTTTGIATTVSTTVILRFWNDNDDIDHLTSLSLEYICHITSLRTQLSSEKIVLDQSCFSCNQIQRDYS